MASTLSLFKVFSLLTLAFELGVQCSSENVPQNPAQGQEGKKMVCYYASWAYNRGGNRKFEVEDIDPFVCTHIIYSFIGLGEDNKVLVLDPRNDLEENGGRGAMRRTTRLRNQNPNLKVMVAVGGGSAGPGRYSDMVRDPANRRTFIESVVPFMQSQGFDGLDFDWEYPAQGEGTRPEDKQNFVLMLNELRAAFQPHGYVLSAAVNGGRWVIDAGYDIPGIANALDFINLMAYDYHGSWEAFTGHHSSLGSNPEFDRGTQSQLNANYSINYFISGGAPAQKLVLGMGTYGRGWILDNPNNNGMYAPARAGFTACPSSQSGECSYNELCEVLQGQPGQWTVVVDQYYQTPYAFSGSNWIGYDDPESFARKARYINEKGLGGAMLWTIDQDDFRGVCNDERYKMIKTVTRGMNGV